MLNSLGYPTPKAMSTGTTIVGLTFKDGVILAADTRYFFISMMSKDILLTYSATEGPIVADKNCEKLHYLADNVISSLSCPPASF